MKNQTITATATKRVMAFVLVTLCLVACLCLPAAVAGLILGLIAKSRGVNDTKNKVGIICSIVGIGLHIVSTIAAIVFLVLYFAFFATVMGSAVMGY